MQTLSLGVDLMVEGEGDESKVLEGRGGGGE